jgi:hypothetical protein
VDDTFAHLADGVDASRYLAGEKGTQLQRVEAVRALLAITTEHFFDRRLAATVDKVTFPQVRDDLARAVQKGVAELAAGHLRPFDLPTELAHLAANVVSFDESLAVDLGYRIAGVASGSDRALEHLTTIVAGGHGQESGLRRVPGADRRRRNSPRGGRSPLSPTLTTSPRAVLDPSSPGWRVGTSPPAGAE